MGIAAACKGVHTVNDVLWHGQFIPTSPSNALARLQIKEAAGAFSWALPVGRRAMAPIVLCAMLLLCSSCVRTQAPASIRQWRLQSTRMPVTKARGLIMGEAPLLGGNMFNHVTHPSAGSVVIQAGTTRKGRPLHRARHRSFVVLMHCSTSGTCSSSDTVSGLMCSSPRADVFVTKLSSQGLKLGVSVC